MQGIIDSLNAVSLRWTAWMLTISWQLFLLTGIIWLVTSGVRKLSGNLRHLLWLLLFVKLLVPPDLGAPWSIGNLLARINVRPPFATELKEGPFLLRAGTQAPDTLMNQADAVPPRVNNPLRETSTLTARTAVFFKLCQPPVYLMCGWAIIFLGVISVLARQYLKHSGRIIRSSSPVSREVKAIFKQQIENLGIKQKASLKMSSSVPTPGVFGLWRPTIYLPEKWKDDLSAAQLADILAHELAHIKRRDIQTGWLLTLLSCLYWFHPAIWLANFKLRREREIACDDLVLSAAGQERKQYARTVLEVSESFNGILPAGVGFIGLFEVPGNLLERLRSITNPRQVRRLGLFSGVLLVLLTLLLMPMGKWAGFSSAQEITGTEKSSVDTSDVPAIWNRLVEVNRIWLDPRPANLTYTLYLGEPPPGGDKQTVERVWISDGNRIRWQMEGDLNYDLIYSGDREVYLKHAHPDRAGVIRKAQGDWRSFCQGSIWWIALHPLFIHGMPENARLVRTYNTAAGTVAVVEVDFLDDPGPFDLGWERHYGRRRGEVGLGLRHRWLGHSSYNLARARIHIRISDFVPILEEDFGEDEAKICEIEIGPEFYHLGNMRAPKTLRYKLERKIQDDKEWILEGRFQIIDGIWLLKQGLNLQDGKVIKRIYTTDISTESVDPVLFEIPENLPTPDRSEKKTEVSEKPAPGPAPEIISVYPPVGATDVDPDTTTKIRVTFDQDMQEGYAWCGGGPDYPPTTGKPYWIEKRTCVLPVKLEPAKFYRVGINSGHYDTFRNLENVPTPAEVVCFTTKGADSGEINAMKAPVIVSLTPENGATNVSSTLKELSVTFDQPMGKGYSWCGGGEGYPETTGRPEWSTDGKTCTVPVKLKSRWTYRVYLNSSRYNSFANERGIPLKPVVWEFTTGD